MIREVIYGPNGPKRWKELHGLLLEMMRFNNGPVSPMLLHKMSPRMLKILRAIRPSDSNASSSCATGSTLWSTRASRSTARPATAVTTCFRRCSKPPTRTDRR
ncbi:hypothetical protein NKH18_14580 [Streptomyces sp. M10(2022)]